MTIILNNTGNPINRTERIKINENWDRIIAGLTEMQYQINTLAGGEDVQKLLEAIHKALDNIAEAQRKTDDLIVITNKAADNADAKAKEAETATQNANIASQKAVEAVNNVTVALADLDLVKQATLTATQNANDATVSATQASVEAKDAAKFSIEETEKAIKNINDTINASLADMTVKVDTSLQNVQVAIEASNKATTDNTQATINAITEAETKVNTAVQNADNATERANIAAEGAEQATEAIKGWGTATVWSADTAYERNNVVTENGSTWQATKANTNSKPSLTTTDWIMLAQRGVDGTGAVSSVNDVLPDENGNVQLDIKQDTVQKVNDKLPNEAGEVTLVASDLGDFSGSLLDDSSVGLAKLAQDVIDKINAGGNAEEVIKTWARELGLGSAPFERKSLQGAQGILAVKESGTYHATDDGTGFLPTNANYLLRVDITFDTLAGVYPMMSMTAINLDINDASSLGKVYNRTFVLKTDGTLDSDTGWSSGGGDSEAVKQWVKGHGLATNTLKKITAAELFTIQESGTYKVYQEYSPSPIMPSMGEYIVELNLSTDRDRTVRVMKVFSGSLYGEVRAFYYRSVVTSNADNSIQNDTGWAALTGDGYAITEEELRAKRLSGNFLVNRVRSPEISFFPAAKEGMKYTYPYAVELSVEFIDIMIRRTFQITEIAEDSTGKLIASTYIRMQGVDNLYPTDVYSDTGWIPTSGGGGNSEAVKQWVKDHGLGGTLKSMSFEEITTLTESGTYYVEWTDEEIQNVPSEFSNGPMFVKLSVSQVNENTLIKNIYITSAISYTAPYVINSSYYSTWAFDKASGNVTEHTDWIKVINQGDLSKVTSPIKWQTATMVNGFTGEIRYGKDTQDVVYMYILITNLASIEPNKIIATLPNGFRPLKNIPIPIAQTNLAPYGNTLPFTINSLGQLVVSFDNKFTGTSTNAGLLGGVTYNVTV